MKDLFRVAGASRHNPAVEQWFREHVGELGRLAHQWFSETRKSGPEVRETLHDHCPTACITDAAFAYVAVFREHVNVGFFRGAELPDPHGLLEGTGRFMRHVKLRPARGVDAAALRRLIGAAHLDMVTRVEAGTE